MDIFLIISGAILMLVGIAGCVLPILPGPPISFFGILLLHWTTRVSFTEDLLWTLALVTVAVTALDYVVPIYGTKKFGGTKKGIWGSTIGLLLGMFFFPPFGIIIGPLVGAFLGELSAGQDTNKAMRSAMGSFLGFLTGTLLKFIACFVMAYYFVAHLL
ncbi:MAG: hypothetical protein COW03_10860 [Cytophagales bacterium CG12_big_fil_rev_8_21_14_0_65_40_12]|nr:MAG: hypothetical protein COW03_10860 [Cytophagales bacterium CG12_big_fil_rev_8_21_14_0_65_40_12]PIW05617.1 MAG: DUF456 domain-containing protein [Cytophagales bacterium CG17_big_fil_post_rev_8_21_14_2_50_40_13]